MEQLTVLDPTPVKIGDTVTIAINADGGDAGMRQ